MTVGDLGTQDPSMTASLANWSFWLYTCWPPFYEPGSPVFLVILWTAPITTSTEILPINSLLLKFTRDSFWSWQPGFQTWSVHFSNLGKLTSLTYKWKCSLYFLLVTFSTNKWFQTHCQSAIVFAITFESREFPCEYITRAIVLIYASTYQDTHWKPIIFDIST